ncbi:CesT family type III secretion system chaperone [Variovorax sp. PBL-E5]|uniref:CesT family type III secretion system chaperone n=1 Tax=Variovorax sp. PBL-E5 TaxID=434014 RepID=UPI00131874B5|nr:CesT family type III secretion system chaperone [Variovorax sp. PBL-E5]VTU35625.1 Tir chaperone protein (CesT) [Variovorax sp. PBL-E5]
MNEEETTSDEEFTNWRGRFISLAEDVCRERGEPAMAVVDDPDNYLLLDLEVDGMTFHILHFPDAMERLVVHCRLGTVPAAQDTGILAGALMSNMPLAYSHAGMFAVDTKTDELVYSTVESLRELTAEQLLRNISTMVTAAEPWSRHCTRPSA